MSNGLLYFLTGDPRCWLSVRSTLRNSNSACRSEQGRASASKTTTAAAARRPRIGCALDNGLQHGLPIIARHPRYLPNTSGDIGMGTCCAQSIMTATAAIVPYGTARSRQQNGTVDAQGVPAHRSGAAPGLGCERRHATVNLTPATGEGE